MQQNSVRGHSIGENLQRSLLRPTKTVPTFSEDAQEKTPMVQNVIDIGICYHLADLTIKEERTV